MLCLLTIKPSNELRVGNEAFGLRQQFLIHEDDMLCILTIKPSNELRVGHEAYDLWQHNTTHEDDTLCILTIKPSNELRVGVQAGCVMPHVYECRIQIGREQALEHLRQDKTQAHLIKKTGDKMFMLT